jgi:tetratricopeptide (TPR) repeat protein
MKRERIEKTTVKKRGILFAVLLLFLVFAAVPGAYGQQAYNAVALEYFKLSLEYLIIGDYDNTILYCTYVLRIDPNSAVAYTVRARAYFERGNMENVISDCTQALRFDRNNVSALSIRASAHERMGNMDRAIADWRAILRINPENSEARRNIELASQQ